MRLESVLEVLEQPSTPVLDEELTSLPLMMRIYLALEQDEFRQKILDLLSARKKPYAESFEIKLPAELVERNSSLPDKVHSAEDIGTVLVGNTRVQIDRILGKPYTNDPEIREIHYKFWDLDEEDPETLAETHWQLIQKETGSYAVSNHREVFSRRGKGIGKLMMAVPEQLFRSLGFEKAIFEATQTGSALFAMKQGYYPPKDALDRAMLKSLLQWKGRHKGVSPECNISEDFVPFIKYFREKEGA